MSRTIRLALAAIALVVLLAAPAAAQSPLPERDGIVANGTDMALSTARINNDFAERIGAPYALDGLALVVDDCNPDPEVYLDQALVDYAIAPRAGALDNDTVAWLVCTDPRFVGFFYAADNPYASVLNEDAVTEAMVEDLRADNFTGAFTSAIDVVAGQLAASSWAPSPDGVGAVTVVPSGLGRTDASGGVSSSGARTSSNDGGSTGGWLAPLAALGVAGAGVWWWRRRGRNGPTVEAPALPAPVRALEEKLAALQQRLMPDNTAQARLVLAYESLGDEAMLAVNRRHEAMLARLAVLAERAAALRADVLGTAAGGATAGVPGRPGSPGGSGAPVGEVSGAPTDEPALAARYREPLAEADALLAYVDGLEAEADHVEMLETKAPVLAVEARKAIAAAAESYAAGAVGLELPSADAALAFAVGLVDAAEAELTAGRRIPAGRMAEDASAIAARTGALPGTFRTLDQAIDEVSALFPRFEAYAASSWADIRGNGSEADESLDTAVDMFGRIVGAERSAFGDDAATGYLASLDKVDEETARARGLAEAVRERLVFLQRAQGQATEAVAAVAAEIDAARAWIARPDVDPAVSAAPVAGLDQAARTLDEARLAMGAPRPDWVAVLRLVNAADRASDEALADARAEHEKVASRRRQLETSRTEAQAAVDRAERFLAGHHADAGSTGTEQVAAARSALGRADEAARACEALQDSALATALVDAATAYDRAREVANAAYDSLAGDVARAEKERSQHVPRPDWMGPIVPIPSRRRTGGGAWGGGWSSGSIRRPSRPSSWGSRPSGSPSRIGGSSSRRGGGRGW